MKLQSGRRLEIEKKWTKFLWNYTDRWITNFRVEEKSRIPPPSALWAVCITPRLMELWATLFAGCGKAAFAFPYAVNSVVHSGMGSYAHCPRCFFCF